MTEDGPLPSTPSPRFRSDATSCVNCAAARHYVLDRQCPQGGFSFYRTPEWGVEEPNALDTYAALASLRRLRTSPPNSGRIVDWLQDLQRTDGSWPSLPIAWAAIEALALLRRTPRSDSRAWLQDIWASRVVAFAGGERDWRGTLGSLLQVVELLRRLDPDVLSGGRDLLQTRFDCARTDGGAWATPGADLETTGIAWRLARRAGLRVDRAALRAWWCRCEDPALGLRFAPHAWMTSVGALLGGLDVAQGLGVMPRYAGAICRQIGMLQHSGGGFGARHQALPSLWDTWQALCAVSRLQRLLRGQL